MTPMNLPTALAFADEYTRRVAAGHGTTLDDVLVTLAAAVRAYRARTSHTALLQEFERALQCKVEYFRDELGEEEIAEDYNTALKVAPGVLDEVLYDLAYELRSLPIGIASSD